MSLEAKGNSVQFKKIPGGIRVIFNTDKQDIFIELGDKEALKFGMATIKAASGHFENPDFTPNCDTVMDSPEWYCDECEAESEGEGGVRFDFAQGFIPQVPNRYPGFPEWVIETQYGYYPIAKWGYCACVSTKDAAIVQLRKPVHAMNRAYSNKTGEIIFLGDTGKVETVPGRKSQ